MSTSLRPTMRHVWLELALLLARRSTCSRLSVGAVITNATLEQVLGVGYNGNAKGLLNQCDDPDAPGSCGCLHAEINALLKAPGQEPGKVLFVSHAPCVMCAKAAVNARIAEVVYAYPYRDDSGLRVLERCHVRVVPFLTPKVESTPGVVGL